MQAALRSGARAALGARRLSSKIGSLPLVYIQGEEMTRYACSLMMAKWIEPHVDTSKWETYDLSCVARDASGDATLRDAVEEAGYELAN